MCYVGAADEVNGGLDVHNTGQNICYSCSEQPKHQIEILQQAKAHAEGQLQLAKRVYRDRTDRLAVEIDEINQELKRYGKKNRGGI